RSVHLGRGTAGLPVPGGAGTGVCQQPHRGACGGPGGGAGVVSLLRRTLPGVSPPAGLHEQSGGGSDGQSCAWGGGDGGTAGADEDGGGEDPVRTASSDGGAG